MIRALAAALLCAGCSFLAAPPAQVAAESFEAARDACSYYEASPTAKHTPKADEACRALRAACEGAGGAE